MALKHESTQKIESLRILIADKQVLFTQALSHVLKERGLLIDTGEDCPSILAKLEATNAFYDLVLLSILPSKAEALECLAAIQEYDSGLNVALIGPWIETDILQESMRLGAVGAVTTDVSLNSLETAIRFMAEGEPFIPASLLHPAHELRKELGSELTNQEKLILESLAMGQKNKEIANTLKIPEAVVKSKIKMLFRKLNVPNRTKAALVARSKGLI